MLPDRLHLFEEVSGNDDGPWDDVWSALCECGDAGTPTLEIDSGDVLITCSTCGMSLFREDELVFMGAIPIEVECIREHDHHWDTIGCECDFYWELKTAKAPKE